jgi:hypothetical protein
MNYSKTPQLKPETIEYFELFYALHHPYDSYITTFRKLEKEWIRRTGVNKYKNYACFRVMKNRYAEHLYYSRRK